MDDPAATRPAIPGRTITVVGHGSASATPDIATINIGVTTHASTAVEASSRNNGLMAAVVARVRDFGVAEKDMQTTYYSLNLQHQQATEKHEARSRYQVANTLWVKVRDLSRISELLDSITGAGANHIVGPYFGVNEPDALKVQARAKAMEDARTCAEHLAHLAGAQLGPVLAITENIGAQPDWGRGNNQALFAVRNADRSFAPISPGESSASYDVQVTFSLS